nr:hypothetical protein [Yimella lutea]
MAVTIEAERSSGPNRNAALGSLSIRGPLPNALLLDLVSGRAPEHSGEHAARRRRQIDVTSVHREDAQGAGLGQLHQVDQITQATIKAVGVPADQYAELIAPQAF